VYQNFTPVIAAAFAWLTLGERWTPGQFVGAAAVLAGIALTRARAGAGIGGPAAEAPGGRTPPDAA